MIEPMRGPRSWSFDSGGESVGMPETDFRVEYRARRDGRGRVELAIALLGCWEHYDFGGDPAGGGEEPGASGGGEAIGRRYLAERRIRDIAWGFVGRRGTLEVDGGTPRAAVIENVTMLSITPSRAGGAGGAAAGAMAVEARAWDIEFGRPLSEAGAEIARRLSFAGRELAARAFVVRYLSEDRTKFREVFRAAPIRVPAGPPLKLVRVSAITEDVSGGKPLERRAAAEGEIRSWAWEMVGEEGELEIDGSAAGVCHLRSCAPSDLTLPDAVIFDLEFVAGYGS